MTVGNIMQELSATAINLADSQREINGVYIGDLLSWVMGRAKADNAWITIMSNINVVAVATLVDTACVILAEGVALDEATVNAAKAKDINIISTDLTAYEVAVKLNKLIAA